MVAMMATAQRVGVQRRAVEIGTAIGTKPRSKIAPISWREARPLQRLVGRARRFWRIGMRYSLGDVP